VVINGAVVVRGCLDYFVVATRLEEVASYFESFKGSLCSAIVSLPLERLASWWLLAW
jgi:hypothetical protein